MIVSSVISRPVQVSVLSNTYAANIAALKAIDISEMAGNTQISVAGYYTPGDGGGGTFYYDSGSSSTDDGGTIIAPDVGNGRWKRIFSGIVNVKHFGARGDGSTNDNDAFRIASALVSSYGGGTLVIPPGTYVIGKQDFAGASGQGYAYRAHDVIRMDNCGSPITIFAQGATLKSASGLKFGSFNPSTGAEYGSISSSLDTRADAPIHFYFSGCSGGVSIIGKVVSDGNVANLTKGSQWGDSGYQVYGYGVLIHDGTQIVDISGLLSKNHPVDGMIIWDVTSAFADRNTCVRVKDSDFLRNGRQGCSIVGGHNISFENCRFSDTGKGDITDNTPGAGVDIEPNTGRYVSDVRFSGCYFENNIGPNLTSNVSGAARIRHISFRDCVFWSSISANVWVPVPGVTFTACEFRGTGAGITYTASGNYDPNRTRFIDCTFVDEPYPGVSYNTSVYNMPITTTGIGTLFSNCTFDNPNGKWQRMLPAYDSVENEYRNCTFLQRRNDIADGSAVGYARSATFSGVNYFKDLSAGPNKYYISSSITANFTGSLIVSGDYVKWNSVNGPNGDVSRFQSRDAPAGQVSVGNSSFATAKIVALTSAAPEGVWGLGDIVINTAVAAAGQRSYAQCTTAGAIGANWAGSTAYGIRSVRKNGSDYYRCIIGGTSASSGGPTGTGTAIVDGTVTWEYVGSTLAVFTAHNL